MRKCCSQHRCSQIACEVCARRYASRFTRQILRTCPRNLATISIDPKFQSIPDFRQWRIEARNLLDYRRRQNRWFRELGLWVWRCQDGQIRGVISLAAVTTDEFKAAFDRRWPTTLRPIDPAALRDDVISVLQPDMISAGESNGRYQSLKLWIWPRNPMRKKSALVAPIHGAWIEPMPVLL